MRNQYNHREVFRSYRDQEILTASPEKLILMLYEEAIKSLQIAIDNMNPKRYDVVNNHIQKAQDIVTELLLALDTEKGGEIAKNLMSLYLYFKQRLLEGNIKKSSPILKEVQSHMKELLEAWKEAIGKVEGQKAAQKPIANRFVAEG